MVIKYINLNEEKIVYQINPIPEDEVPTKALLPTLDNYFKKGMIQKLTSESIVSCDYVVIVDEEENELLDIEYRSKYSETFIITVDHKSGEVKIFFGGRNTHMDLLDEIHIYDEDLWIDWNCDTHSYYIYDPNIEIICGRFWTDAKVIATWNSSRFLAEKEDANFSGALAKALVEKYKQLRQIDISNYEYLYDDYGNESYAINLSDYIAFNIDSQENIPLLYTKFKKINHTEIPYHKREFWKLGLPFESCTKKTRS